jgi:hypothetical protein
LNFKAEANSLRKEINEETAWKKLDYEDDYEEYDDEGDRYRASAQRTGPWMDAVEQARPWGNRARKRSRAEHKEDWGWCVGRPVSFYFLQVQAPPASQFINHITGSV